MSKISFFLLSVVLVINLYITKATRGAENPEIPTTSGRKVKTRPPYCGLFCLYTSARLANQEIDFKSLVKQNYLGPSGSSLAQLKTAAEDHGMYAVILTDLTTHILREIPFPAILHVRPRVGFGLYDHYELFLGAENGKAKLYDPPDPIRVVPFREIGPRWDGNALIVSAKPIDLGAVFAPARKRFIIYTAIALIIILTVHWAKRWLPETIKRSRSKLFGLSITEGALFAIVALLCGMIYHFANDEGLLANANATASVQKVHRHNFIPKVSEKKVHKLLDNDTIFIDARYSRDFKAGHLEGAISVPVNSTKKERQTKTTNISKDARIVVYCQSVGCKFAERLAIRLMNDDFSNISIFKGGWAEWTAKNGRKKEKQI